MLRELGEAREEARSERKAADAMRQQVANPNPSLTLTLTPTLTLTLTLTLAGGLRARAGAGAGRAEGHDGAQAVPCARECAGVAGNG